MAGSPSDVTAPVLSVESLAVSLPGTGAVLHGVNLYVHVGEMLALVGISGSGKTTAAMAIPRLLPAGAAVTGRITVAGTDIATLAPPALRHMRGNGIGVVFQDPLAALNPAMRVGAFIAETLRTHRGLARREAWARAVALMEEAGIEHAAARARHYPHQFSGGMRQRALIAAALACDPALLIADEPTSGLDASLRSGILDLLARLRRTRGLAVLLISHDLGLVARCADRVAVLDGGTIVETGSAAAVLAAPAHPATQAMRNAILMPAPPASSIGASLLRVENLEVHYGPRAAVSDASFTLRHGECLGISGASGSGKSSLGRAVIGMEHYRGRVVLAGTDLGALHGRARRAVLRRMQMVFQDPAASLNPWMSVAATIDEALRFGGAPNAAGNTPAEAWLARVGLPPAMLRRRVGTLSGGQVQRVAVARALAAAPDLIVLDEPTASLDSVAQSSLLSLLRDLTAESNVSLILITHDQAVLRALAHRVLSLQDGRLSGKT
jgi:microcin C transport system ATP-binding protein